jgi:hypothetical protein
MNKLKLAAIDLSLTPCETQRIFELHRASYMYKFGSESQFPSFLPPWYNWENILEFFQLMFAMKFKIDKDECGIFIFDETAESSFWTLTHTEGEVKSRRLQIDASHEQLLADIEQFAFWGMNAYKVIKAITMAKDVFNERIEVWEMFNSSRAPYAMIWDYETSDMFLKKNNCVLMKSYDDFFALNLLEW